MKPYNVKSKLRYTPKEEAWFIEQLTKMVDAGLYERPQQANGRLSLWNSKPKIVPKRDTYRLAFDYSQIKETMPGSQMELMSEVSDYIALPSHKIFMTADLKDAYWSVPVHPEDREIFAFNAPGFGQLQPTRMPQGAQSSAYSMNEMMNIVMGALPPLPNELQSSDYAIPCDGTKEEPYDGL